MLQDLLLICLVYVNKFVFLLQHLNAANSTSAYMHSTIQFMCDNIFLNKLDSFFKKFMSMKIILKLLRNKIFNSNSSIFKLSTFLYLQVNIYILLYQLYWSFVSTYTYFNTNKYIVALFTFLYYSVQLCMEYHSKPSTSNNWRSNVIPFKIN